MWLISEVFDPSAARTVEVSLRSGEMAKTDGTVHTSFREVKDQSWALRHGRGVPIWIAWLARQTLGRLWLQVLLQLSQLASAYVP